MPFTRYGDEPLQTFSALTDPGADRIAFWDESANEMAWLTASTGLTITGTSMTSSGGGGGISDGDTLSTGLTFPVAGLHILDTNASHDLILSPGSDLTADRTLTFTTGDASRTLTIGADSTISGVAYVASGTDVALADGGTGASLADPGADRILFWDDSAGAVTWLTAGSGLTITDTTISSTGGGASTLDDLTDVVITSPAIGHAFYHDGTTWVNGAQSKLAAGSTSAPSYSFASDPGTGVWYGGSNNVAISANGSLTAAFESGITSLYRGIANSSPPVLSAAKARDSVASPSAITTGDDLFQISASGYVGSTGGYVEAARVLFDSTGTIADNSTGVGGIIRLSTRAVGGSLTEKLTIADDGSVTLVSGTSASELRLTEPSGSGSSYTGFKSPALASSVIYTLPNAFPTTDGYVLSCTTAGVMSWAASGGGLSYFTEAQSTSSPNDTIYADSFTAGGAASNIDAVIAPKGTGGFLAQVPDGTTTGGNKRGTYAVDLQHFARTSATQVASGNGSAIIGGIYNESSGAYSQAHGAWALADHLAEMAWASGYLGSQGDMQHSLVGWGKTTANGTQAEIFLGAASTYRFTVASDVTYGFEIHVVARRTDADNESAYWILRGCIDNNAGTTALVGTVSIETVADDSAGVWSVTAEADNTNDALVVKVTGATSKTINWTAAGHMTKSKG